MPFLVSMSLGDRFVEYLKERGVRADLVGIVALSAEAPFVAYLAAAPSIDPLTAWSVGLASLAAAAVGAWRASVALAPVSQAARSLRRYARSGEHHPLPKGQPGIVGNLVDSIVEVRRRTDGVRASLARLADMDVLTNLPNRRAFMDFVATADLSGGYAIAVVDVDHFKLVNQAAGYDAGDRVLGVVAAHLRTGVRATDYVARLGGEEFVVILPGASQDEARLVLDRIRERVLADAALGAGPAPLSISGGVSAANENDAGVADVIRRAGACLLRAKGDGFNRIAVAGA